MTETEKVTQIFLNNIDTIPVVMGSIEYSKVFATGAFIDVRDYSSPQKLAEHMTYLMQNDTAYNLYIEGQHLISC